mmetsp:Transcript_70242/g.164485  ORF Transcript_70242/g.164485 Transcript_70242/m.164485 type:complete len:452 (-) Transcript_70242:265-1620(-)
MTQVELGQARGCEDDHKDDVDAVGILRVQELIGRNVKLLQEIISDATSASFAEGDVILPAGEQVEKMYFLRSGEASIHVDNVRVERVPSGSILGLAAMFENPQLPVEIRAAGPCQCRVISRNNFHAALQNYPEDLLHLQNEGSRMQKQDGDRWKRLGAVQRTKKKLKAIASMRAERASQKAAEADDEAVAPVRSSRALQKAPRDEEEDHSSSSLDLPQQVPRLHGATASAEGAQSMPYPPSLRPRQDEARRRAKVQMIRAQLQLRARGAIQPSGKLGKLSRLRAGDDPEKPTEASSSGGPIPKLEDALLGKSLQLQDTDCDSPLYEKFAFDFDDDELSPLSPVSPGLSPGSEKSGSLFWQISEPDMPSRGETERQNSKQAILTMANPFERSVSSDRPTSRRLRSREGGAETTTTRSMPLGRLAAIRGRNSAKFRGVLPGLSSARSGASGTT